MHNNPSKADVIRTSIAIPTIVVFIMFMFVLISSVPNPSPLLWALFIGDIVLSIASTVVNFYTNRMQVHQEVKSEMKEEENV